MPSAILRDQRPNRARVLPSAPKVDISTQHRFLAMALLIVHVHVHVRPEFVDAFRDASLANARASVLEPGVARFDVCQHADNPTRFVLVEVYRNAGAPALHKETEHYATWRDAVAPMMAEPRTSVKFTNVFPDDAGW